MRMVTLYSLMDHHHLTISFETLWNVFIAAQCAASRMLANNEYIQYACVALLMSGSASRC